MWCVRTLYKLTRFFWKLKAILEYSLLRKKKLAYSSSSFSNTEKIGVK